MKFDNLFGKKFPVIFLFSRPVSFTTSFGVLFALNDELFVSWQLLILIFPDTDVKLSELNHHFRCIFIYLTQANAMPR